MITYFILSYFLGSIMTGYIVVKLLGEKDIREQGSGNVGARNAGRIHGKKGFILTFLGDAAKGALVIIIARTFHYSEEVQLAGLALAILGHIKPIFLQFKGGKGVSTFIGGIILFEPYVVPPIIAIFLFLYFFLKSFTLSGLGAFLLIPVTLYYLEFSGLSILLVSGMLIMLYAAHIDNIKERLEKNERKS
ncbi:glycerol-3-phosphate acyltransferase [Neobacillus sp. LXY-4]|uniref:glycerol-3-phosphate acyltransferase n=1 Tax=Neobacillus sp. LXY-4 TaxID=3379826 RepID=UPI003EE285B5